MVQHAEFKSQDKSLRRQMIIDAAVKVFHGKGYRAATLDDVAGELGLTRPALYHYVSSKEDLLSKIYLQALESFFATIYEIAGMDLSPREKLRLFIQRHLKTIVIENLAMFSVFFSEENQLAQKDFQKIRKEKRKFTKVLEGIIEEGMAHGHFRKVSPRLQANAIIGMCNWLYRWYKPGQSAFSPAEIAEEFTSLVERGLVIQGVGHEKGEGQGSGGEVQLLRELQAASQKVVELVRELDAKTRAS
jgi:AcrR family transcriptional regulator